MRIRNMVAATAFLATSLAIGGTAGAAESNTSTRPGGPTMEFLCELSGGVYYQGTYVSYCFYRDGTIVACYDDGHCTTYPPRTKNVATLPAGGGISQVAR